MDGKLGDLIMPPSGATFFHVALKPFLTAFWSVFNLIVILLPLLVTFPGTLVPHALSSSELSVSRTGERRDYRYIE